MNNGHRKTGNPDPLLTRAEAANYLGISPATLDRATARGELRAVRLTARPRFRVSELERYLDAATDGSH